MRLILFGATGGTGRYLLEQALGAGHAVTALVRNPARLPAREGKVRIVQGDVRDPEAVQAAILSGGDAVLSTLGVRTLFFATTVLSQGMRNIVQAMQKAGMRRLIVESSYGVGERNLALGWKLAAATALRGIYEDKQREDRILAASDLDWTIVRPPRLTNGPHTGKYRVELNLKLPFSASIARADVADFMLRQVEDLTYIQRAVVVSRERQAADNADG